MCVFPPSIIQIFDSDERKVDISFGIALSMALVAKHVSEAIFRHLLPRFGLLSEEEANDYYSYVYEGEFPDSYLGETKTDMT